MKCNGHEIPDEKIICSRVGTAAPTGKNLITRGIEVIIGIKAPGADPAMVCVRTKVGDNPVIYVKLEDFRCSGCDVLCSSLPCQVPQLGYLRATECSIENMVIVFKD